MCTSGFTRACASKWAKTRDGLGYEYYDVYYCKYCLKMQSKSLNVITYVPLYDAKPMEAEKTFNGEPQTLPKI